MKTLVAAVCTLTHLLTLNWLQVDIGGDNQLLHYLKLTKDILVCKTFLNTRNVFNNNKINVHYVRIEFIIGFLEGEKVRDLAFQLKKNSIWSELLKTLDKLTQGLSSDLK